jgi:hypothetical protein
MAYTLNGIGTTFYGQRDFRADGTYVTTEWIAFLYFPILPLRSLRVRYVGPGDPPTFGFGSSESYSVYEKRFPNWKQVLFTYGYVGFMIAWIDFICTTATSIFPHALDTVFGVTMILIGCIIPVPTPWIVRYYAMRKRRA